MSLAFVGVLKLHESTRLNFEILNSESKKREDELVKLKRREELAINLTKLALQYDYGIKFRKSNLNWELEWIDEIIEALDGEEITIVFEVMSSPLNPLAHAIICRELQDPFDWEKIHFPTFLLKMWQEPLIVEAVFARVNGTGTYSEISVEELPPPTSIYRVMDEIVAMRASMNVPTALFYLKKKGLEPNQFRNSL